LERSNRIIFVYKGQEQILESIGLFQKPLVYMLMPPVWLMLPINLLHGLTFSALWVAGVSYANEVACWWMGQRRKGCSRGCGMKGFDFRAVHPLP
jgi:hypothetical protein